MARDGMPGRRGSPPDPNQRTETANPDRLESWKDIAAYLNRGVRTAIRWEREEGLPVRRHIHQSRASVYAFKSELDAWREQRGLPGERTEASEPPPSRPVRRPAVYITACAAALAVLAVLLSYLNRRPAPVIVPLTTLRGIEVNPTFSPDGTRIAFAWDNDVADQFDIYEREVAGDGPPLRLTTNSAPYVAPSWSPDGLHIAFLRELPEFRRYGVFVIPASGGAERKLAEIYARDPAPALTWTPDGHWLLTPHQATESAPVSLFLVSVSTGEMRRATEPPALSRGDSEGAFSPDGSVLALAHTVTPVSAAIYFAPVTANWETTGQRSPVDTEMWCCSTRIVWTSPNELLYTKMHHGAVTLWRATRGGDAEPAFAGAPGQLGNGAVAISRGGDKLAYSDYRSGPSLWRLDLTRGATPTPFLRSAGHERYASISPDGSRVCFVSTRTGASAIWISDRDGRNETQLTNMGSGAAPRWSPDGTEIAFDASAGGALNVYVVSASGGKPRQMTSGGSANGLPNWSRDGTWLYFMSNRGGGKPQVWKLSTAEHNLIQVTRNGGWLAQESPDGKFIYFSKTHDDGSGETAGVWRMPVAGGEETLVVDGLPDLRNFVVVDDGIYFESMRSRREFDLSFYRFATERSERIASIAKPSFEGLSVSPDRRWALFSSFDEQGGDLWLVDHLK